MNDNTNQSSVISREIRSEDAKLYFLRIGLALLVLRIVTTGLQYIVSYIFARYFWDIYLTWWFNWILSLAPLYLAAIPLYYIVLPKSISPVGEKRRFGVGRLAVVCIISVAGMIVFNLVGFYFTDIIRVASGNVLGRTDALNTIITSSPAWVTVIFACVLAPIMEELTFRKLLIDRAKPFGELEACLLSGLAFGLFHGNFRQFFYATAIGLIFAYVYTKTNNIFYTIGLHMGINLLGSVISPMIFSEKNLSIIESITNPQSVNTSDLLTLLLVAGTMIIGFALVVTGIVLFIVNIKKIRFDRSPYTVAGGVNRSIYGNPGMISAIIVMGAMFIVALLP